MGGAQSANHPPLQPPQCRAAAPSFLYIFTACFFPSRRAGRVRGDFSAPVKNIAPLFFFEVSLFFALPYRDCSFQNGDFF